MIPAVPMGGETDAYAPLRRPSFRRFLAGAFAANVGTQILKVAAGYEIYRSTHSVQALLGLGLVAYLPILALSLQAGWLVDRFERRGVLAGALALQALSAAGLALLVHAGGPVWAWYPLLLVAASGRAIQSPAAVSVYPALLEPKELSRGVTWNSATYQVGCVVGPLLGGLLLSGLGTTMTLGLVALGPLICMALLPGLALLRPFPPMADERPRERLMGGFTFLGRNRAILGALAVDFVAVLFGGVDGILPMFAADILRCGPVGLGALNAAPFVGSLIMSFRLAHRPRLKRPGRLMLGAVLAFGLCMLAFAVSRHLAGSLLALLGSGLFDQVSVYVRQSLVQLRTPEALRGRVQAVNFLFIGSSNELGECESALSAWVLGPVGSVVLGGVAVLLVVLGAARIFPELRRLKTLEPETAPEAP